MLRFLLPALVLVSSGVLDAQSRSLELYWIDVEGGAATLSHTIVNGRNGFSKTYTARECAGQSGRMAAVPPEGYSMAHDSS